MKFSRQIGNVQLMQKINRLKVLNFVRQNQPISRPLVAKETGLSLSSITNIITYLMDMNVISETGIEDVERVGRKATLLKFNSEAYNLICINIGREKLFIALTDLSGKQIEKKSIMIDHSQARSVIEDIKIEISDIMNRYNRDKILGIGISVPGLILEHKSSIFSTSLKWRTIAMKDELEEFLKKPVIIENDSIAKAVWQINSSDLSQERNVTFLDMENGIGAVQLYKGSISRGVIGEIGHTTVDKDGEDCACGNRGCLEVMCSVEKILRDCRNLLKEGKSSTLKDLAGEGDINYEMVEKAVKLGDEEVKKILSECGEYLGIGIANMINIFNPSRIIINGGELLKIDFLYEKAIDCAMRRAYMELTEGLKIEKVKININQTLEGFAIHLCDSLFDISFPQNIIE